jgi:telomerase protein component 1
MDVEHENISNKRKFGDAEDVVVFQRLTPHELKVLKESLLNIVSAALIQQPKMSIKDPTIRKITKLIKQIAFYDPEFVLKLAMYVRLDLNIRSTANYLLAVASNIEECRPFMKKYFSGTIRLPSDWLDVAATYSILPDKSLKGNSIPTCLRKAMVAKFPDFDVYQLGKYNKERSIKRKTKKLKQEQIKGNTSAKPPEKPMITLKQMIRLLHINQPHLQVMCLLGKKYPLTEREFNVTGLLGKFELEKAGTRMKLPTPETWETLLSEKGNKSSTWEELIEHKKLPFMAMLRNIRNMIYTGVHPKYHRWVCNKLSNKQTVAQSKQFPFQFFSAYEVIPKDMEHFKKLLAGQNDDKDKKGKKVF